MSTPDCPSAASGDRCDRRQSCEGTYILTFQPNDGAPIAIKGTQAEGADLRLQTSKAGKGIRTLDIQLGKLTLYQLSYARITVGSLSIQPAHPCTTRAHHARSVHGRATPVPAQCNHVNNFLELPGSTPALHLAFHCGDEELATTHHQR